MKKGWKTAHIFAHKDPHPAKDLHIILWEAGRGQVRRCLKPFMPSICSLRNGFTLIEDGLRFLNHFLTAHIFSHKKWKKWEAKVGITFLFPALWIKSGLWLQVPDVRTHLNAHVCAICVLLWTTFPDLLAHLWHRFVLAASHEAAWFQRYLTMCEYEYIEQFNRWFLQQLVFVMESRCGNVGYRKRGLSVCTDFW